MVRKVQLIFFTKKLQILDKWCFDAHILIYKGYKIETFPFYLR